MIRKLLVSLLICAALAACSSSSPLAGTWVGNSKVSGIGAITFGNDGTFEASNAASSSPAFSGTWEIKDNQINLFIDHSKGRELSRDEAQTLMGLLSKDGKQIAIGSAIFSRQH